MKHSYIEALGLTKEYLKGEQSITPLAGLSMEVFPAEFIALMGPSGSGKTTLLNIIAGVDSPSSGSLRIGDSHLDQMNRDQLTSWRSRNIGYIFQLYHLLPVLSAYENVELPLLIHSMKKKERRARVEAVMEQVGLVDRMNHRPNELSGGQEQRVAIARALVTDPSLIVADEPTGDLDRQSADEILDLLQSLSEVQKRTIVMVTHDPKAAARASRLLELEKGKLLQSK
ncbi:ABC transporter ATP-binding protein [Opitutales bacterium]|uniref:ABC transporter ATP-binding protein n=1 Tax=Candidatus Chordibacter forsetii TaxID=3381758 RepID=UPI00236FA51D|nr:ABC transporter ATP-binding protein [Opitutales bacterium]